MVCQIETTNLPALIMSEVGLEILGESKREINPNFNRRLTPIHVPRSFIFYITQSWEVFISFLLTELL